MSGVVRLVRLVLVVAIAAMLGFALYLALTWSPLFAGIDILFYRGVLLCGVAAALLALLLGLFARRLGIDAATALAATMSSASLNLAFLIILPVTIDRSISVFLLAQIEAHETGAPLDTPGLRQVFVDRYVGAMAQIDRRVAEQTASGNIRVERGRLTLTPRGHRFLRLSRLIARAFRTDPRFVAADGR